MTSRTEFYELLQVSKDVTEQDLKRAYRKQALRLHPDRGGDPEQFKRMKYAYDVLLDPKKRQVYDQYGEQAVKAMEGGMTPEAAMMVFRGIGKKERLVLVAGLSVLTGYLLLFPILLSIRWDNSKSMSFAWVFLPVWLALVSIVGGCLCFVRAPEFDPAEDDEEMRAQIEEMQRQTRNLRCSSILVVTALFVFLLLLVLRLDDHDTWSYFAVLWPWMLFDVVLLLRKLFYAEASFLMLGGNPEILGAGNKWASKEWNCHILSLARSHCFQLAFVVLVAVKMDGKEMSWWVVFSPVWFDWSLSLFASLFRCTSVKSEAEMDALPEERRQEEDTRGAILCTFIVQLIGLGCVALFCGKLVHEDAYSAFVVFIPVFVAGGCFCCCLSCGVILMDNPPPPGESQAAQPSATPAPPEYGSMEAGAAVPETD